MSGPASRTHELLLPTVWCMMSNLGSTISSKIDLGSGAPSGLPPDFYLKNLQTALTSKPVQQQTREGGSLGLVRAIAKFHEQSYPQLDPACVQVVNGAHVGMYVCMAAFINPGDQIIVFDPSYSYYRKQSHLHQGVVVGVPLLPKCLQSRKDLKGRMQNGVGFGAADQWHFDAAQLRESFNHQTKMIIINAPHNPTGKIFSNQDLQTIAQLLRQNPQTIIVEDNIYESYVFDRFDYKTISKLSQRQQFKSRCLSIYSAGKLFKATGVRLGWVIGSAPLIERIRYANQCIYSYSSGLLEKGVELSLQHLATSKNQYCREEAQRLQANRDILLKQLVSCELDFAIWVPQSGFFVMLDVSQFQPKQQYRRDGDGQPVPHDNACALHFLYEYGIVSIPCSSFFEQTAAGGDKYLRLTFCKDQALLLQVGKRLKQH